MEFRMTKSKPYNLIIKPFIESKAKFLRIFPMKRKTFVEGEKLEISFELENTSDQDFPEECFICALIGLLNSKSEKASQFFL